jgi:3-hydroxyacyl-CoA dehydrogenase
MGPFEIWDALGVRDFTAQIEADGYKVAAWVHTMLEGGCESFYQRDASGAPVAYYDPARGYVSMGGVPTLHAAYLHKGGKEIERNAGASLLDAGDGVLLLEFHTKANALDPDIFAMVHKSLERLNTDFDGMVIGNNGDYFSAGANLGLLAMAAVNGAYDQIEDMVRTGQQTMMAIRHAPKPVVTAPFNLALGGGCEMTMHGSQVVAFAELYIGLVEFGVGVIPAWGGCKEMLRRVVNPIAQLPDGDILAALKKVFEQIALAKVSTSAMDAREMGILQPTDRIVMNRDRQLAEAKRAVLNLAKGGYTPTPRGKVYAAGRPRRDQCRCVHAARRALCQRTRREDCPQIGACADGWQSLRRGVGGRTVHSGSGTRSVYEPDG